ncbi:MAG TPA: glycerol kinase GlpK [Burkholderiales bacterium]|nr:glycerol kinase GlpK [Burkholderiales bacterium]
MMAGYILALDQGTTSSRAIVFDAAAGVRAVAQKELAQHYPQPGWVEQDPREIWSSQVGVAAEALSRAGLSAHDIAAIGIANQRETTVVWHRRTGEPISNAIVWQDRRTARFCEGLKREGLEPLFESRTGLIIDPYFSGSKVRWILDHVPGARQAAERGELAFGTVDSWLVWKLSGGRRHVTDASNASRTLLYNIHAGAWDEKLLGILGVPRSMLPEVVPSSGEIALTDPDLFPAGIPIAGMAGDQQAALFGQCCHAPGMAKNTYGTGCFLLMHTGAVPTHSRNHLLTTVAWKIGDRTEFADEGSIFIGGAVVQWLRDGLGLIRSADEVERLAASVPDSAGVHFVPAFTGLGAPYWDPHARGLICGLTRGSTGGHLARAALESMAFQTTDVLRAMEADAAIRVAQLRVDGGAARDNLLMQFQADMLGVPVVRPRTTETTALGAAFLAGLAVAYWEDREQLSSLWWEERRFEPRMSRDEAATRYAAWRAAVARARSQPAASDFAP